MASYGVVTKRPASRGMSALADLGAADSMNAVGEMDPSKLAAPYGTADPYGGAPYTAGSAEQAADMQSYATAHPDAWIGDRDAMLENVQGKRLQTQAALEGLRSIVRGSQQANNPQADVDRANLMAAQKRNQVGPDTEAAAAAQFGPSASAAHRQATNDALDKLYAQFVKPAQVTSEGRVQAADETASARIDAAEARANAEISIARAKAAAGDTTWRAAVAEINRGKVDENGKAVPFTPQEADAIIQKYKPGAEHFSPDIEAKIDQAVQTGRYSREDVIAYLRSSGQIR